MLLSYYYCTPPWCQHGQSFGPLQKKSKGQKNHVGSLQKTHFKCRCITLMSLNQFSVLCWSLSFFPWLKRNVCPDRTLTLVHSSSVHSCFPEQSGESRPAILNAVRVSHRTALTLRTIERIDSTCIQNSFTGALRCV